MDENATFLIPKNTPYYHINASDDERVLLLSQTTLPQLLNLIQDDDFIYDCGYDFWGREGGQDFYSADGEMGNMYEGKYGEAGAPVTWEANFIPDITKFDKLKTWNRLGATRIVFIRSGEGYSLLWRPEWDYKVKVDWSVHSLVTPPAGWYHQHFNTGNEPAGQFAIHGPRTGSLHEHAIFDAHDPSNVIDYVDEDPGIRELYKRELDENGLEFRMPEESYTDPDYDFEAATL